MEAPDKSYFTDIVPTPRYIWGVVFSIIGMLVTVVTVLGWGAVANLVNQGDRIFALQETDREHGERITRLEEKTQNVLDAINNLRKDEAAYQDKVNAKLDNLISKMP